jgi:hypothetical protein
MNSAQPPHAQREVFFIGDTVGFTDKHPRASPPVPPSR